MKVRGGFNRAVRAPNIGELFLPVITGLTSLSIDPCAGAAPVGNANLTAVCIAQGASAGSIGTIQNPAAGQANRTFGGDPTIRPESADTFTIGAVLTPTFAPGLSITVDYFNVVVTNAITNPTPGDVIGACFNNVTASSSTSLACTGIRRNPANGRLSGPTGTVFGLPTPLTNLGRIETSGIDLNAAYSTDVGFAKLSFNLIGTYTISNKFQSISRLQPPQFTALGVNRECVGQYSVNCGISGGGIQPEWTHNLRTTLDFGAANISLLWTHIGGVEYERILPRAFRGTITGSGPLVGRQVDFNSIRAYNYFDLATGVKVMDNISLDFLVSNLFDEKPPIVGSTLGTTGQNSGNTYPSTYDTLGRRYTMTLGVRF
jgi:outer membrane receptor protein involved in Fe transport